MNTYKFDKFEHMGDFQVNINYHKRAKRNKKKKI